MGPNRLRLRRKVKIGPLLEQTETIGKGHYRRLARLQPGEFVKQARTPFERSIREAIRPAALGRVSRAKHSSSGRVGCPTVARAGNSPREANRNGKYVFVIHG